MVVHVFFLVLQRVCLDSLQKYCKMHANCKLQIWGFNSCKQRLIDHFKILNLATFETQKKRI